MSYLFKLSVVFFIICLNIKITFGQSFVDSVHSVINKTENKVAKPYVALAQYYLSSYPDSSIYYARRAHEIGKSTNNELAVIRSLSIEADALQRKQNTAKAIKKYLQAAKLAENAKEKTKHNAYVLGSIYNGLGLCYYYMNDFKKTTHYLKLALKAKLRAEDYTYYTLILSNLAAIYIRNGAYQEAFDALFQSEKMVLQQNKKKYLPQIYNTIGACYQMALPKSDSALIYYQKSLVVGKQLNNYASVAVAAHNVGEYFLNKKQYSEAIQYLEIAKKANRKRKTNKDKYSIRLYATLSAIYDSLGNYQKAYYYKQKEYEYNQKVFTLESKKAIEELDVKYQTLKKEQRITQQNKKIQQGEYARNKVVIGFLLVLLILGIVFYFFYQKNRVKQQFEHDKLKLFENIVHEIRTPLTLIGGPIQVIKESEGKNAGEQIAMAEKNIQKLNHLINELLDASKLGKGKYQLSYSIGEIEQFMAELLANFELAAEQKNMKIVYQDHSKNLLYSLPTNALEKIISNLVGNAIKYCKPNTTITVETSVDDLLLTLKISDNGNGIAKKDQKRIFDRFYRGSYNADVTGTGIGLALVKDLVNLTHGEIQFLSNEKGTEFNISIPIQLEEQNTTIQIQEKDKPSLLLVEDNADIVKFVTSFMEDTFLIVSAQNGKQALEKIEETLPEIILTDIMMPEMDGVEFLQEIKSNELTDHIPVVIFSAKGSLESRLEGLNKGADAYIPKPFSPEELRLTIQNLFKTIKINQENYKQSLESNKTFEERVKSTNPFVNKMIAFVIQNIDDTEYSVNELADNAAVSRSQLHRKLIATTGLSTTNFVRMIRLEKAKDLLKEGGLNITEIAYQCGFNSQSYFTRSFTEYFGESPSKFVV